jgi:hypothetical protein
MMDRALVAPVCRQDRAGQARALPVRLWIFGRDGSQDDFIRKAKKARKKIFQHLAKRRFAAARGSPALNFLDIPPGPPIYEITILYWLDALDQ